MKAKKLLMIAVLLFILVSCKYEEVKPSDDKNKTEVYLEGNEGGLGDDDSHPPYTKD